MARIRGCAASGLDLGQGLLQLAAGGVVRGVVGVEGDGAQQPRIQVNRLHREPGGFEVAAHLHAPWTPTAAAASRASPTPTDTSASGKSRCVWLSMTGTGSGSGAGG